MPILQPGWSELFPALSGGIFLKERHRRRKNFKQKAGKGNVYLLFRPRTRSGNRTHTILLSLDFESSASTNSAIRAFS